MLQPAQRTDVVLPALLPLVADEWDRVGEAAVTSLAVLLTCLPAHWRDEDLQVRAGGPMARSSNLRMFLKGMSSLHLRSSRCTQLRDVVIQYAHTCADRDRLVRRRRDTSDHSVAALC